MFSSKEFDIFSYLNEGAAETIHKSENSYTKYDEHPGTPNVNLFQNIEEDEPVIAAITTKKSRQGRRIAGERPMTAPNTKDTTKSSAGFIRPINTAKDSQFQEFKPLSPIKEEFKITDQPSFTPIENYRLTDPTSFTPMDNYRLPDPATITSKEYNRFPDPPSFTPIDNMRSTAPPLFTPMEKLQKPVEVKTQVQNIQLSPRSLKAKLLEKELENAIEERKSGLIEQKRQLEEDLKRDIELLSANHESQLMELKQGFELKRFSLQSYKEHSEKIANLSQMISQQSQIVNILSTKFSKEKEFLEDIKHQELQAKEKALEMRENRIIVQLKSLDQSKSTLLYKQKQLLELESKWQADIESEKEKLAEEQNSMKELKEILKQKEREKKNLLAVEMHKLELLQDHVEREEKLIEEEIKAKENEINERQAMMDQEKNEAYASIQYEKNYLSSQISQLDSFRRNIPIVDADLNKRAALCEEKYKSVLAESENLKKAQEMLEKDRLVFEKEGQKIHQICTELDKESEILMEQREELERKRAEIDKKRQEVICIKEMSRADVQRVEQLKISVSQRKRVYESLKTPAKELDLPKYEQTVEYEPEPQRVNYRPRSVASRSTFKASEYIRDLEPYNKVRDDMKNYIFNEGNRLLNSKLDYETGLQRSYKSSLHEFSTPNSSYYKKNSGSVYFNAASFAKPGDSRLLISSFTDPKYDIAYKN